MRRFYTNAAVEPDGSAFRVVLDGRPVRTPGKRPLILPTRALAEALAREWHDQAEEIEPSAMPLTRLANSAIDRTVPYRQAVIEQVAAYAASDLLCYRADAPEELVLRQAASWQPLLDWLDDTHGAALRVTAGVTPVEQDREALVAVYSAVAAFDDFRLTGLHATTTACGSVVLGLALAARRLDADAAFGAAHLDELYQAEHWGSDTLAEQRRAALGAEIAAAADFMALAGPDG